MRPKNLKTKIFLDSGDPKDTKEVLAFLGFLDGQTTNPSLIASNPETKAHFEKIKAGTRNIGVQNVGAQNFEPTQRESLQKELLNFYKKIIQEIAEIIPKKSISIEVYADENTTTDQMFGQAVEMNSWIPNAHIKLPIIKNGLVVAQKLTAQGIKVNMTLCFTQEQAGAVYNATTGKKGDVFVSPFVGRLDDRGEDGMSLIENILKMYQKGDGHVEVLVASVRTIEHFMCALKLGADIITAPLKILKQWRELGMPIPDSDYAHKTSLKNIEYQEIALDKNWSEYNIAHELTDKGLEKFAGDWNGLVK
jgi:transaldolase